MLNSFFDTNANPLAIKMCVIVLVFIIFPGMVDGSGLLSWPQTGGITILTPEQAAFATQDQSQIVVTGGNEQITGTADACMSYHVSAHKIISMFPVRKKT